MEPVVLPVVCVGSPAEGAPPRVVLTPVAVVHRMEVLKVVPLTGGVKAMRRDLGGVAPLERTVVVSAGSRT